MKFFQGGVGIENVGSYHFTESSLYLNSNAALGVNITHVPNRILASHLQIVAEYIY